MGTLVKADRAIAPLNDLLFPFVQPDQLSGQHSPWVGSVNTTVNGLRVS